MKKTRLILWCEKCKKDTLHEEVGEEELRTTWKKYKCLRCGAISYLSKIIS